MIANKEAKNILKKERIEGGLLNLKNIYLVTNYANYTNYTNGLYEGKWYR